jgi:hypothetical protein
MTPEEQEALSYKYVAPHILRLSSGRYAVYDRRRDLMAIFNSIEEATGLIEELSKLPEPEAPKTRPKNDTLSLDDLGL